ncbi:glycosyltransferase, partial [bacterium]|nr:glycosyltransferase [bacterium]
MIFFILFAWMTGLVYLAFLIIVFVGLLRLKDSPLVEDDSLLPTVSIVVAARDEETRIGRLLDSLQDQDYPHGKVEVIVVDDRSSDNTSSLVNHRKGGSLDFQVLRIRDGETPSGRSPKKYALSKGIEITTGEVIVTTD